MEYKGKKLRHELKYFINYNEYIYLTTRLSTMLNRDAHSILTGYHITSLYFDDIYNNALEEKESGIEFRKKYRIRIYNFGDKIISLECKEKFGEFISKSSIRLTKDQYYALLHGGDINFLLDNGKQMPKEMFCDIKSSFLAPAVIVDYEREAFVLDNGNVRITFDKNLQAGINTVDMYAKELMMADVMPPNMMILEVKFDDYLPDYTRKILQIDSHIRSAASKYVMCRLLQFERRPTARFESHPFIYENHRLPV